MPWKPRDCYEEIRELNSGSEGKTSLVKSTTTGRVFVVKQTHTIRANRCTAALSYKPTPREAHLLLEVLRPHQNIVKMFGCEVFNLQTKNMYFAYCSGDDLIDQIDHFLKNKMYAPEAFVLHVCIELVQALAYLHWGLRWNDFEKSWSRDRKHILQVRQRVPGLGAKLNLPRPAKSGPR